MKNIDDILTWKQNFGLLPIHLLPTQRDDKSYIMLNGGYGDFCLKTISEEKSPENYHTLAWSSNTKNFVVLTDELVKIYNWKKDKQESIQKRQVEENFEKFYSYLVTNSYKTDIDIVPFVIDIFKQMRNFTHEKNNAVEALNLLFVLLTGLEEDLNSVNFNDWGLSKIEIPQNFYLYLDRLKRGVSNITPKLDLIIRHSAGVLFQEAQKEVISFDRQLDIWGGFSNKIDNRKSLYSSIHYTPSYLARAIVENAIKKIDYNKKTLKIFDPACGSSEFLIEALKQLHENGYLGKVQIIGWDSSESAINTSKFLLTYEKKTIWNDRLRFDLKLVDDSLKEEWANDCDLILMNPPFISWEHLSKETRDIVKGVLNSNITGRPNQASAFFYKAIHVLKADGVIGCVIPSTLLTLDTYHKLRLEIHDMISFDLIGKLGNFVFEDALTDVSLLIGHKPKGNSTPYILWTKNEKGIAHEALRDLRKMVSSEIHTVIEKDYSIYKPSIFPIAKENWKPISFLEENLLKSIAFLKEASQILELDKIFDVKQGSLTGNNKIFKISFDFHDNLPESEKKYFRPVIDSKSIKNGVLQIENYIWFPYSKDGLSLKTENELSSKVPFFYNNRLKINKLDLEHREGVSFWWELTRPRKWQLDKLPKLCSTRFGNSNSYAYDYTGEFVVENGCALVLKRDSKNINLYFFYLALFNSQIYNTLLSIHSRQLAGGQWYDLGNKYIRNIPIPNVYSSDVLETPAFNQLVEIGNDLFEGRSYLKAMLNDILIKNFYPQSQY